MANKIKNKLEDIHAGQVGQFIPRIKKRVMGLQDAVIDWTFSKVVKTLYRVNMMKHMEKPLKDYIVKNISEQKEIKTEGNMVFVMVDGIKCCVTTPNPSLQMLDPTKVKSDYPHFMVKQLDMAKLELVKDKLAKLDVWTEVLDNEQVKKLAVELREKDSKTPVAKSRFSKYFALVAQTPRVELK